MTKLTKLISIIAFCVSGLTCFAQTNSKQDSIDLLDRTIANIDSMDWVNPDSDKIDRTTFKSFQGYARSYRQEKQMAKEGLYDNGTLITGKMYFYGSDNRLLRIAIYFDTKYIGDVPRYQIPHEFLPLSKDTILKITNGK